LIIEFGFELICVCPISSGRGQVDATGPRVDLNRFRREWQSLKNKKKSETKMM